MHKTPILIGNWKMYKTRAQARAFVAALRPHLPLTGVQVCLAVPFTAIDASAEAANDSNLMIGAQNMSDAIEGAFTGEISVKMLQEAGAQFVLLGHSERRTLFGESNAFIHRKMKRAQESRLTAVLCVGENLDEREKGHTKSVLTKQLEECLHGIEPRDVMIAYEPVWAIGTGKAATPQIAEEVHAICRDFLSKLWGDRATDIPILYGGSVKPDNIKALLEMKEINGVLVGGASLEVESFAGLIHQAGGRT